RISSPARKPSRSVPSSTALRPPAVTRPPWRARPPDMGGDCDPRVTSHPSQHAPPPGGDDVVVDVHDVHYAIDSRPIFSGLDIQARRGRITAIMGPSGTGKTTLLRLITAQIAADRGRVSVFGRDVERLRGAEVYAMRKRMGMLFQNGALLTDMSVFEN